MKFRKLLFVCFFLALFAIVAIAVTPGYYNSTAPNEYDNQTSLLGKILYALKNGATVTTPLATSGTNTLITGSTNIALSGSTFQFTFVPTVSGTYYYMIGTGTAGATNAMPLSTTIIESSVAASGTISLTATGSLYQYQH